MTAPKERLLAKFNENFIAIDSEADAVTKALEMGINHFSLAKQFTAVHEGRKLKSEAEILPGEIFISSSQPLWRDQLVAKLQKEYAARDAAYRSAQSADISAHNGDLYNATDCASSTTMSAAFYARALEEQITTHQNSPENSLFIHVNGEENLGEYKQLLPDSRVYDRSGKLVFGSP